MGNKPIDIMSDEFLADPNPLLAKQRDNAPVVYSESLDMWLILRHSDVERIFLDHGAFSAQGSDPIWPIHSEATRILEQGFRSFRPMSCLEGDEHARIRGHAAIGFTADRLKHLEPVARSLAASLARDLDHRLDEEEAVDLVRAFAEPYPSALMFELLGFPQEDWLSIKTWCDQRMALSWGRPSPAEQIQIATNLIRYLRYCEQHVHRQAQQPGTNLTADLIQTLHQCPRSLSMDEITHVIYGLSFSGHETVSHLLANSIVAALPDSNLWRSLRNARAAARATEEGLRHSSSVVAWRRTTTREVDVGGTLLPAGARLLLMLGAANHDSEVFTSPRMFLIDRANVRRHLSFGRGRHHCLGSSLARLEVRIALQELSRRLPSLQLAEEAPHRYISSAAFRGPVAVPVRRGT